MNATATELKVGDEVMDFDCNRHKIEKIEYGVYTIGCKEYRQEYGSERLVSAGRGSAANRSMYPIDKHWLAKERQKQEAAAELMALGVGDHVVHPKAGRYKSPLLKITEVKADRFKADIFWFHRDTGEHIASSKSDRFKVRPATAEDFDAEEKRLAKEADDDRKAKQRESAREARRTAWIAKQTEAIALTWLHGKGPEAAAEILRQACEAWEYLE